MSPVVKLISRGLLRCTSITLAALRYLGPWQPDLGLSSAGFSATLRLAWRPDLGALALEALAVIGASLWVSHLCNFLLHLHNHSGTSQFFLHLPHHVLLPRLRGWIKRLPVCSDPVRALGAFQIICSFFDDLLVFSDVWVMLLMKVFLGSRTPHLYLFDASGPPRSAFEVQLSIGN